MCVCAHFLQLSLNSCKIRHLTDTMTQVLICWLSPWYVCCVCVCLLYLSCEFFSPESSLNSAERKLLSQTVERRKNYDDNDMNSTYLHFKLHIHWMPLVNVEFRYFICTQREKVTEKNEDFQRERERERGTKFFRNQVNQNVILHLYIQIPGTELFFPCSSHHFGLFLMFCAEVYHSILLPLSYKI